MKRTQKQTHLDFPLMELLSLIVAMPYCGTYIIKWVS